MIFKISLYICLKDNIGRSPSFLTRIAETSRINNSQAILIFDKRPMRMPIHDNIIVTG